MDKEGAAPDRVKKREAEAVSSLFSWLRGEAVSLRSLCKGEVGEWKCSPSETSLGKKGQSLMSGNFLRMETDEWKEMPDCLAYTHSISSCQLRALSRAHLLDLSSAYQKGLTQSQLPFLGAAQIQTCLCKEHTGQTSLSSWANRERPSWLQNSPGNWPRLVAALQSNSLSLPSAQPSFLVLKNTSHWLCACHSPPNLLLSVKNWRVWNLYLKASKLICHRLIDSGRRPKTPGSRTKNVVAHGPVGSMNFMFTGTFLAPQILQGDTEHRVGLHHSQRTLSLGNPIFYFII